MVFPPPRGGRPRARPPPGEGDGDRLPGALTAQAAEYARECPVGPAPPRLQGRRGRGRRAGGERAGGGRLERGPRPACAPPHGERRGDARPPPRCEGQGPRWASLLETWFVPPLCQRREPERAPCPTEGGGSFPAQVLSLPCCHVRCDFLLLAFCHDCEASSAPRNWRRACRLTS
ncbi:toll-like receptor 6 isoform X2 [Macaca mulatta]